VEKIRLGGMALQNGVLVHGPTAWGAAVRDARGELRVASGPKRRFAHRVTVPVVRGPLRLAEAIAVLPDVRRSLPEARFPFERPAVVTAVVAGSALAAAARRTPINVVAREALVAIASLAPATVALRGGDLAGYHGAEHVSIGTYEQDGTRHAREHERCGSHLIGPLLVTSAVAAAAAARAPRRARPITRLAGAAGAVGVSVEIFAWMERNRRHPVARALARPGMALQRHLSTAEPTGEQLDVADAALRACLAAEAGAEPADAG
jgi:uncharacterized protein YqhQ